MPVCLITLHAYRSWAEDNPRGFVKKGRQGVEPPSAALAHNRARRAKHPPRRFTSRQRTLIIDCARDIADRRDWQVHAVSATPTHIHVLVSWRDASSDVDPATVFKRLIGMMLSRDSGTTGNRWFSAGCDRTRVRDRRHLDELRNRYLPKHIDENGVVWVQGRGLIGGESDGSTG